jgi:ADP-ribose pyrophosphatase YjhB (NUDIX family)
VLHILPAPVHQWALRLAHGTRLRWWRLTGKVVRGCNVIATNAAGHIVLVRHSYHLNGLWMLPGGGLDKGESLLDAAGRELAEEVGCVLADPLHVATITFEWSRWTNVIELVAGTTPDVPQPDGREIAACGFFDPRALPHPTSEPAKAMIARWLSLQNGSSA